MLDKPRSAKTKCIMRHTVRSAGNCPRRFPRSPKPAQARAAVSPAQRAQQLEPAQPGNLGEFGLETGLRRANVTGLQWSQVDLVRRVALIHPDQAKARKAITVPVSNWEAGKRWRWCNAMRTCRRTTWRNGWRP